MTDPNQHDRITEMVARACDGLSEHCESVRIFITAKCEANSENWITYSEGRGNIYTQEGQIAEWIERQRERMRIDERRRERDSEKE